MKLNGAETRECSDSVTPLEEALFDYLPYLLCGWRVALICLNFISDSRILDWRGLWRPPSRTQLCICEIIEARKRQGTCFKSHRFFPLGLYYRVKKRKQRLFETRMWSVARTKMDCFSWLCRNLRDLLVYTFTQLFWPGAKRPGGRKEKIKQDPKGQHLVETHANVMLPMSSSISCHPPVVCPSLGSGLWLSALEAGLLKTLQAILLGGVLQGQEARPD